MKKFLLVATVVKTHVNTFHLPTLKMMKDKGYEVHVASHNDFETKSDLLIPFCDNFIEIPFERSPLKINNIKSYQMLKKLFKNENYDIIHCHTPVGSALTRLAAREVRKNDTKVLYTAHGFHFYIGAPTINWLFYYPVEKILSKYTDVLITINKEDYNRAQTFKANQTEYVPGVGIDLENIKVDTERILELKKCLSLTIDDFVLCSIGELNSNKNHKVVIEALFEINKKNIKYLIAGSGEKELELKKLVKKFGLEDQVHFLGYRDDIYELLELSDVFVFPSYREGLSKSLMEAMAMKKPIIASDIRGNRDLVDVNKGGYLISPTDSKSLSKYIKKMFVNSDLITKMGDYNIQKVKRFSLPVVQKKLETIYENL